MVSDAVHDQAYLEVIRWRDVVLPILKEEERRIDIMISENPGLAGKLGPYKLYIEKSMIQLSASGVTIAGLSEENCHRLIGWIKALVRHLQTSSLFMNLGETTVLDDVRDQTYKEVLQSSDLLPILEEVDIQIEGMISQSQELADKFGGIKTYFQNFINLLSTSRDAIDRLDEEGCRGLLWTIKRRALQLRSIIRRPGAVAQPWPTRISLQAKELSQKNPSKEVLSNKWYDHLYMEVKYMRYTYSRVLHVEHRRLEWLISKGTVAANTFEPLKCFLEKSLNLMYLWRADIAHAHKKECRMLVKMIKLFVMCKLIKGYAKKGGEYVWPLQNLFAISEVLRQMNMESRSDQVGFEAVSSYSQCPRPDSCLSEGEWHNQAYKELQAMRILYSSQLDEAYTNIYKERLCETLSGASDKFLKKSLELLMTSRAEMVFLSKEKCYYRMMLIKFFVVLNSLQPQASASSNSVHHIQSESLHNWRDLVYEELRGLRRKYSSRLDEAYRTLSGVCNQKPQLESNCKADCRRFLKESLNFLASTRADLALHSKEDCPVRLMHIRYYFKYPKDFVSAEQHEEFVKSFSDPTHQSLLYWRDEAYAEMKSKETKLRYEVEVAFKKIHKLTYQIPELAKEFEEARVPFYRAWYFMTLPRSEMACLSEEEYNEKVLLVNGGLATVQEILTSLQISLGRRIRFPCDISKIILKQRNST